MSLRPIKRETAVTQQTWHESPATINNETFSLDFVSRTHANKVTQGFPALHVPLRPAKEMNKETFFSLKKRTWLKESVGGEGQMAWMEWTTRVQVMTT
jgi:hypothetical protein